MNLGALAAALLLLGCASGGSAPPTEPGPYIILFGTGDSSLNTTAQQIIIQIATAAREQRPLRVKVEGYGDTEGTPGVPLGHQRALTVIQALGTAGVNPGIIHEQFSMGGPNTPTGIPVHKVTVTFEP